MRQRRRQPKHGGFSLIEILVVIGIIALLMGILLPTMERVRHQGYIANCASNLRQIGQAIVLYCNDNRGECPRTTYVPGAAIAKGTGILSANPFAAGGAGGPSANDVTASIYLLLRAKLPAKMVICPYNDVNEFTPDTADPLTQSNFANYKKNLGYSFANPYPDAAAAATGYRLTTRLSAEFAIASDLNPGTANPRDDVTAPVPTSPWSIQKKAISENHEKDGENVLYGDGHVQWQKTSFCGVAQDNIFTNKSNQVEASPSDKLDSVLLPVQ
jgi:prepilin-type N-terminal cleavage/methylation domain-containing protein